MSLVTSLANGLSVDMAGIVILLFVLLQFVPMDSKIVPLNYLTIPFEDDSAATQEDNDDILFENPFHKLLGQNEGNENNNGGEYTMPIQKKIYDKKKKPCSVVVLSNVQNPSTQSLLRRYRYDGNGILIPSSVKYYIKLPQGYGVPPILVPLNDKAFSPVGGFVRYYKEVPPIPPTW